MMCKAYDMTAKYWELRKRFQAVMCEMCAGHR